MVKVLPALFLLTTLLLSKPLFAEGTVSNQVQGPQEKKLISLEDCFNLLYEHSVEIRQANLELQIAKREFEKVRNQFNLGMETDYTMSSSEFGGSSVNSQLFGTNQTRDTFNMGLDQPLRTGGNLGLDYSQSKSETDSSFGDPLTFGSSLGLTWFQPLFQNGTHSATLYQQHAAELSLAQAMLNAQSSIIAIRFDMITKFLDCMSKQEEVKILDLSTKTNEQILKVSRARRKAGLTTKLDVLESELQYKTSLSNHRRGSGQQVRSLQNLARSLGTPIGKGTTVTYQLNFVPGVPDFDSSKKKAMLHRNEVEIQQIQVSSAKLDRDFRRNQQEPNIELVSSLSYSGEGNTKSEGSKLDNKSYSVGIAYTTRFGKRDERIDYEIYQDKVKTAELSYKQLEQDITLEIANNIQALKDAEDLVKLTDDEQVLAEEKFKFMKIAHENQLRILSDVLEAERQLTETRAEKIKSLISHLTARLNLLKSEGSTLTLDAIMGEQEKGAK